MRKKQHLHLQTKLFIELVINDYCWHTSKVFIKRRYEIWNEKST